MKRRAFKFLVVALLVILAAIPLVSCGDGSNSGGGESADAKTTVFVTKGEDGFVNRVTVTYADDKVLSVEDVWEETHKTKDDYYKQRVNDMNSAKDVDIDGYNVKVEINDLELKSTITIDMSKANVKDLYNNWTWWETDKDYLSYQEVYDNFVTDSGYEVE